MAVVWPKQTRELLTLAIGLSMVLGAIAGLCTVVWLAWSCILPRDRIGDAIALGWIVSVCLVMADNAKQQKRRKAKQASAMWPDELRRAAILAEQMKLPGATDTR
jgi:hypothetical protein